MSKNEVLLNDCTLAQDKTTEQMVEMKAEMVPILVVLTTYALRGTRGPGFEVDRSLKQQTTHNIDLSSSKQIYTPSKCS